MGDVGNDRRHSADYVFQIAKRFIYLPERQFLTSALTTLPLALIPLSFGHSVVRYRLMDVDVVVRRALVYAMTTVAIAMMIGAVALGLVFLAVGNNLSTTEITLRALIAIVAMAGIVLLVRTAQKIFTGTRRPLFLRRTLRSAARFARFRQNAFGNDRARTASQRSDRTSATGSRCRKSRGFYRG